ncbi:MAG: FHA domain-containing protein [Aromatoleum sp.]|nr:FHA domain-containing protein [Aromatoleum sp.]
MAKLVLSKDGVAVHQCWLDKDRLTVGRGTGNDVVIDDPAASREHAAITCVGNDHIVEDLQSSNGTFVNGTRIIRHILQHGDVVEFGALHLRYVNPRASADVDLERTMLIPGLQRGGDDLSPAPDSQDADDGVPSARAARVHFPRGRVKVLAGARAGSTIELDRVVAAFGKGGHRLAVVTRRPHGYFITHVEGRRYPRVNHQSIGAEPHPLRNGDVIDIADESLEFLLD